MALLRLGQTYQALGDHAAAIGWYQQNLVSFPRTPAAVSSLVPLADCFIATGQPDKAEQTLLRIVDRPLDDPLSVITPAADEYREALFRLGDLYLRSDAFEKAIARYEEARERYPDDERFGRATFLLAESCRRSAARIREDLNDTKNIAYVDHLKRTHEARLLRARKLYDRVIESYPDPPAAADAYDLEAMYVKLSHFYRADVVYDLAQTSDPSDLRPYVEAWELYDRAAWLYQGDPIAMSAYVQMINCHLRLGNAGRARMALQRAKWALRGMEDERFGGPPAAEDRKFWADYFAWLEQMPTLAGGAGEGSS
jgi:tetratricopeptide (TPR) repeat protein